MVAVLGACADDVGGSDPAPTAIVQQRVDAYDEIVAGTLLVGGHCHRDVRVTVSESADVDLVANRDATDDSQRLPTSGRRADASLPGLDRDT